MIGYLLNTCYESGTVLNPAQILLNFKVVLITKEIHYFRSNVDEQNEKLNPL